VLVWVVTRLAPTYRTPEPPASITDPADAAQRDAVLQYAATLKFDSTTHGAHDRQRLTDCSAGTCTLGPLATVLPESGSVRSPVDGLYGRGRIVALMHTAGPYRKLGLASGVNYVWVRNVNRQTGTGEAIIIPADRNAPADTVPVHYVRHTSPATRFAIARWLFHPTDDVGCEDCAPNGWCVIGAIDLTRFDALTAQFR
jgi:hypothetical protein